MADPITNELATAALAFHRKPRPGKLEIQATKPLATQRDLALAYSPGVAAACLAIAADPAEADTMTIRQNLVAVLSNGTAVLGLGNIGPLASKPVMEGKAVLFKKFAGIDVFDIEVDCNDPKKLIEVVAALEPTFGGINLEDIKAPECFEVERTLRERMAIPVFHDDQHGTAIIVAAAVTNAMEFAGKDLRDAKIVTSGAGAAALACLDMLVTIGARHENITATDIEGVVYKGRQALMDPRKDIYARETTARTLAEVIDGADVFLGLSAAGVLKKELLVKMANKPLIMALANPNPEIDPADALEARPDAMICTGRSDYPNQVNNVLCFPYIFRGALDVSATAINEEMKLAAVRAIASLAQEPPSEMVARAYGGTARLYGKDSLIPSPFDPRLILRIAPAVAKAAMDSGVARKPIRDFDGYMDELNRFVFRSGLLMKPLMTAARKDPKRVIYTDGEEERVLSAVQTIVEERIAHPIVIGRPDVIETRVKRYGLTIRPGRDFAIVDPEDDPRYREYVQTYLDCAGRMGVTPASARLLVRTNATIIAAIAVKRGDADAMICGFVGGFHKRLRSIREIIGMAPGVHDFSAVSMLIANKGQLFITDTQVQHDPSAEDIAEMARLTGSLVRRFGLEPKVALLSHSDFGSDDSPSACKMRDALALLRRSSPDLEVDGEMQADTALSQLVRDRVLPGSTLKGEANVLVMPNIEAANISAQMVKMMTQALSVGPILIGAAQPAHILTTTTTARGILNMTALAVVEAQEAATRAAVGGASVAQAPATMG